MKILWFILDCQHGVRARRNWPLRVHSKQPDVTATYANLDMNLRQYVGFAPRRRRTQDQY